MCRISRLDLVVKARTGHETLLSRNPENTLRTKAKARPRHSAIVGTAATNAGLLAEQGGNRRGTNI